MAIPPPMPPLDGLALNPAADIQVLQIGAEKQTVLIVDDAVEDPAPLVDYAVSTTSFGPPGEGSYYPGLNARLPSNYLPLFMAALRPQLTRLFRVAPSHPLPSFGFFGLATLRDEDLDPLQIVPHVDTYKWPSFAAVHYLCGPEFGGTGFFRQVSTGFETVSPSRNYAYNRVLKTEMAASSDPKVLGAFYERIAAVDAKFNRLILYSASQLHSPLAVGDRLCTEPRAGRLTANIFINTL
jgi:hypothetical protein